MPYLSGSTAVLWLSVVRLDVVQHAGLLSRGRAAMIFPLVGHAAESNQQIVQTGW